MLDKLKDLETAITNSLDSFRTAKLTDIYDAGLPDVKGPKPMTLTFFKDKVEISYKEYLFLDRKIILKPHDILELEIGVQNTSTTANALTGVLAGCFLAGSLGALALAGQAAKRRKEDSLHLVINYKGQPRPLHFQKTQKSQKLYKEFKRLFDLSTNKQTNQTKLQINNNDLAKQLTDLNNLVQQGILTQEEFETQKIKLLNG